MTESDSLWARAGQDLLIPVGNGRADRVVWEHSARVARLTSAMVDLPQFGDERIDRLALAAAALYHDAGWVLECRQGKVGRLEALTRAATEAQREIAADWMRARLAELLPGGTLETAALAIIECPLRSTECIEARVLSDADNLDEIGPHVLCLMLRRHVLEGGSLGDVLEAWDRQQEYHYWEARIKDGLQYDPTRAMARRRLAALTTVMESLRRCVDLEDLEEMVPRRRKKGDKSRR